MNKHSDIDPPPSRARATITDVITHVTNVVRKEIELARAEINEKFTQAGRAIAFLALAAIVALVALNVLAAAAVSAIAATGIGTGWAALIVGGLFLLIAAAFALKGGRDLKPENLAPKRTAERAHRVADAVKEKF